MYGFAVFKTFKEAFNVMAMGSSIEDVQLQHRWYSNWSWIKSESAVGTFFSSLIESLNNDCVQEILRHVDLLHLIYIAHINENFKGIVAERLSMLQIFPVNVGSIHLMNFRYLLEMFSGSIKNISLSLNAFSSPLGIYCSYTKSIILRIIYKCSGNELKSVCLYDFNSTEIEMENFDYILQLFSAKGTKIVFES